MPVIQRRDIQLQSQQNALLPRLRAGACRWKNPTAAAAGEGWSRHLVLCGLCQQGLQWYTRRRWQRRSEEQNGDDHAMTVAFKLTFVIRGGIRGRTTQLALQGTPPMPSFIQEGEVGWLEWWRWSGAREASDADTPGSNTDRYVGGKRARHSAAKKNRRPSCTQPPRDTWLSRLPMRRQPWHAGGGEREYFTGRVQVLFFLLFFYLLEQRGGCRDLREQQVMVVVVVGILMNGHLLMVLILRGEAPAESDCQATAGEQSMGREEGSVCACVMIFSTPTSLTTTIKPPTPTPPNWWRRQQYSLDGVTAKTFYQQMLPQP